MFSCRFLSRFYQAAVRDEILDSGEAVDVVNFIEDDQAEDSSDAGDGSDAGTRICIMNLGDEGYFSILIQNADVHGFGVQIDSTVIFVLFGIEIHIGLLVRFFRLLIIPLCGILRDILMSIN